MRVIIIFLFVCTVWGYMVVVAVLCLQTCAILICDDWCIFVSYFRPVFAFSQGFTFIFNWLNDVLFWFNIEQCPDLLGLICWC